MNYPNKFSPSDICKFCCSKESEVLRNLTPLELVEKDLGRIDDKYVLKYAPVGNYCYDENEFHRKECQGILLVLISLMP